MTYALGSKHWVAAIAAAGALAVSGCSAADPDDVGSVTSQPAASASAEPSASASPAESASAAPSASSPPTGSPSASAAPTVSPSESPSESPSAEPTASPEPTAAPTPTGTTPDAVGFCTAAELSGSVQEQLGGAAAGTVARTLVVTNSSTGNCIVQGYPGVSYVDAAGTQLGAPAERRSAEAPAITLAPGTSAVADLFQTNAQNYGADCGQTTAAGLRVYPPEATDSLFLPQSIPACTAPSIALMTVGTFRAAG